MRIFLFFMLLAFSFYAEAQSPKIPLLEVLEGEPSSIINGCVSVISGNYVETEVDLFVQGPSPIKVARAYSSTDNKRGSLCRGWEFNHFGQITDNKKSITYLEDMGASADYIKDRSGMYHIDPKSLQTGITNTGSGEISAKTNIKNQIINFDSSNQFCSVSQGNGSIRIFKPVKKLKKKYFLSKELLPNGHKFQYVYSDKNKIAKIKGKNSSGEVFNWVNFLHDKDYVNIRSNLGHRVKYYLTKSERIEGSKLLEMVKRSHAPTITYKYKFYEDEGKERIYFKKYPESRFLKINYYKQSKLRDRKDLRSGKVYKLKAPVGQDAEPVKIYRFYYTKRTSYLEKERITEVYDAYDHLTSYHIDKNSRLEKIVNYKGTSNYNIYRTERIFWGKNGKSNSTNLISRSIETKEGWVQMCRAMSYDHKGNVLKETIFGNLTGDNKHPVVLTPSGIPQSNGVENYEKLYTYTPDEYNRKTSEEDFRSKIIYEYYPNNELVKTKIITDKNEIKLTTQYEYDTNGVLIKEITVGGNQKLIKEIIPTNTIPLGLPCEVINKYYDFEEHQEKQLKRVVNHHTVEGYLYQQDHYDSKNTFVYSLYWEYDKHGNVLKEVNPLGQEIDRKYDANGNLVYEQGPNPYSYKEFTYDYSNRLIREEIVDEKGKKYPTTYTYDYRGNKTSETDPFGNTTTFIYDEFNRLIMTKLPKSEDEEGNEVEQTLMTEYNELDFPIKKINPKFETIQTKYNIRGQPTEVTYPDGSVEKKIYTLDGKLAKQIDKNKFTTRYTYDYQARLTHTAYYSPEGELIWEESSEYDPNHIIKKTDRNGVVTNYTYDPAGRLIQTDEEGKITQYQYDTLGRKIRTIIDHRIHYCYEYDHLNHIVEERIEDQLGECYSKKNFRFNLEGKQTEVITYCQSGVSIQKKEYDRLGRVIQVTDPYGNSKFTHYNKNTITEIYPNGNHIITHLDPLKRDHKKIIKDPLGKILRSEKYYYDFRGNKVKVEYTFFDGENEKKMTHRWKYNALKQLMSFSEIGQDGIDRTTKYTYNKDGTKDSVVKPNGVILYYQYDLKQRKTHVYSSDETVDFFITHNIDGKVVEYHDIITDQKGIRQYDNYQNLISETLANGNKIDFQYDKLGRVIRKIYPDHSQVHYEWRGPYQYKIKRIDPEGNEKYVHTYEEYDLSGNLLSSQLIGQAGTLEYQYDLKRVKEISHSNWNEKILDYDASNNIKQLEQDGKQINFQYDTLNQLIKDASNQYTYDTLYNRTKKNHQTYAIGSLNQLLADTVSYFKYDMNGNLIRQNDTHFVYDALDRLIEVINPTSTHQYIYDFLNRRITKDEKNFMYEEENEVGIYADGTFEELRILGKGKGAEIGASIAIELQGQVYVPLHDFQGSISHLLDLEGKIVERNEYTAYGEEEVDETLSPWRFSSKRYDIETGFYYFGRRYYHPSTGRWITPDPIREHDGPNLYAYVFNSPIIHFDLYGLWTHAENPYIRHSFLCKAMRMPGRLLKGFAENWIPVPVVRDVVSCSGHLLSGRSLRTFVPSKYQPHSCVMSLGKERLCPKSVVLSVNGIYTSCTEAWRHAYHLSRYYGGENIIYAYNATHGFLTDVLECVLNIIGIPTSSVYNLVDAIRFSIDEVGGVGNGGVVYLDAHSQGGIITYRALQMLKPNERAMLRVATLGTSKIMKQSGTMSMDHYMNTRDGVPLIADPIGYIRNLISPSENVHFIQSKTLPLVDHLIEGDNYQGVLKYLGKEYMKANGLI